MKSERFVLRQCQQEGFWVVTDTANGIELRFREHKFSSSKALRLLPCVGCSEFDRAMNLPGYIQEMSEWLCKNKYDIACQSSLDQRRAICQQIRALREHRGITQVSLAIMARVSVSKISAIEAGNYSFGLDILIRIANVLGARVNIIDHH